MHIFAEVVYLQYPQLLFMPSIQQEKEDQEDQEDQE